MRQLIRLDRFSAWLLFASMLLYFISGYGMTKGLISTKLAGDLHLSWLTYFVLMSFVVHTAFATYLALKRWGVWQSYGKYLWLIFYTLFIFGFVYVDRVYIRPIDENTSPSTVSTTTPASTSTTPSTSTTTTGISTTDTTSVSTETKTFNAATLAEYNGKNGQLSYVAVSGKVYDVSDLFINGEHRGCSAGQDVTTYFGSEHSSSMLSGFPVVGTYTP